MNLKQKEEGIIRFPRKIFTSLKIFLKMKKKLLNNRVANVIRLNDDYLKKNIYYFIEKTTTATLRPRACQKKKFKTKQSKIKKHY